MPCLAFKHMVHFVRDCPTELNKRQFKEKGYVYALLFKSGALKIGSSFSPLYRIKEGWITNSDICKVLIAGPTADFRTIERGFIRSFKHLLTEGWNGGPREIWNLSPWILDMVLKSFESDFSDVSLQRVYLAVDAAWESHSTPTPA